MLNAQCTSTCYGRKEKNKIDTANVKSMPNKMHEQKKLNSYYRDQQRCSVCCVEWMMCAGHSAYWNIYFDITLRIRIEITKRTKKKHFSLQSVASEMNGGTHSMCHNYIDVECIVQSPLLFFICADKESCAFYAYAALSTQRKHLRPRQNETKQNKNYCNYSKSSATQWSGDFVYVLFRFNMIHDDFLLPLFRFIFSIL